MWRHIIQSVNGFRRGAACCAPTRSYDRRYRQPAIPIPSAFRVKAWFAPAASAGTGWGCVATTLPLASRNSKVTVSGVLGLDRLFVSSPSTLAAFSVVEIGRAHV